MRLRSVACGVLSNEEDAADVCQEAFLKAYKNLSTFRGHSSFYTWMYRIVFNLCIDLSRKSSRRHEIACGEISVLEQGASSPHMEHLASLPASPEKNLYRSELANEIKKAMDSLSPPHRSVIMLREVEGLTYEEISCALGCSVGTVMSRLYHARKKLTVVLEKSLSETVMTGDL
jgi:RNA polymerase sigma-70 factor (ECF subfamily)